jgi:hypothetical protein
MSIVRTTAIASLSAQLLIGAITSAGFFINSKYDDLNIILSFEVSSQAVEFLWYLSVLVGAQTITAQLRYIDWVVSTPIMLISLGMFFLHRENVDTSVWNLFDTFEIYACLILNWMMLAFGFAVETGRISRPAGVFAGSLCLIGSFTFLAMLIERDVISRVLFWVTFVVWGLYGIAAVLDDIAKNVMYNTIDVVSKNGFGLFLFLYTAYL